MSKLVYKNCKLYSGGYNLSGDVNEMSFEYEFKEVPAFDFSSTAEYSIPGLPKIAYDLKGAVQMNSPTLAVEDILMAQIVTLDNPLTFCALTGADGDIAYFTKACGFTYSPGAPVGDLYKYQAKGAGSGEVLVRGQMAATGAKTVTGTGTALNLGAVTAAQKVYAALHVVAASGAAPTLDVIVESDDAQGFATPVTRATFAQQNAISSAFVSAAGPITDTWWRAKWTIGGGGPSFTVAVVIGIQ